MSTIPVLQKLRQVSPTFKGILDDIIKPSPKRQQIRRYMKGLGETSRAECSLGMHETHKNQTRKILRKCTGVEDTVNKGNYRSKINGTQRNNHVNAMAEAQDVRRISCVFQAG